MRRTIGTLILLFATANSLAQDPFSKLEIRVRGTQNVNRTILHENWHPARGVKISLGTPFYAGEWELSLGIHRFNASSDVPGFGALWISSNWGIRIPIGSRFHLKPALAIGNYRMSFDDSGLGFRGENNESEFVGSTEIMGTFEFVRNWFLFGGVEYLRIQTTPLMRLWFSSVGIGVQIPSTGRMKKILE